MTTKTPAQELREIAELLRRNSQNWIVPDLLSLADRIEREHRAVVLPEPRTVSMCVNRYEAKGFNKCIEMVKELNGVKS